MNSKIKTVLLIGAMAKIPTSVYAHHSFSMFESDKTVEMVGTVKEFQWTNPHSWVQIIVTDDKGQMTEWSFETNSPSAMTRQGWRPKSVVAGDKVTIRMHPLKDGAPGGQLMEVVLPSGKQLGTGIN